jgi:3-hydroxybutyryl-CoA dehydrogenase
VGRGLVKLCLKNELSSVVFLRDKSKISALSEEIKKYLSAKYPDNNFQLPVFTDELDKVAHSDVIIEAIDEQLTDKVNILYKMKKYIQKDSVIGTTTSSLSINEIAEKSMLGKRLCGLHFFNPVHAVKFLEIIPCLDLEKIYLKKAIEFVGLINYDYVIVPDIPGFIANRILFSSILEAVDLVVRHNVSENEVDKIIKFSLSHPMGPFELIRLIGVETVDKILNNIHHGAKALNSWNSYYKKQ